MADPINRAHLEQLASRFGSAFVVQLIDLFIAQGGERIAAAQQAAAAGDGDGVSAAAHALKSSAGNLGASPLGRRAAEVERAAVSEQGNTTLPTLVAALHDDFEDACAALQSARSALGDLGGSG